MNLKFNKSYIILLLPCVCFLLTGLLLAVIFIFCEIAPFGNYTFAVMDGDIQYLDLFCYFKDCIEGKNSLIYSFSKGIGGGMISDFAYYLSSPFNLLVMFFDKANMQQCFDVIVAFKLCLAAATANIYFLSRFSKYLKKENYSYSKLIIFVIVSVCYALCQYCIEQTSNIMWLDGVYMLPLILLFAHKCVYQKKSIGLCVTIILSMIFNWYTGVINCLFLVAYYFLECVLYLQENEITHKWQFLIMRIVRLLIILLICAAIVVVIMLPVLKTMIGQSGASRIYLKSLFNPKFDSNPLAVFNGLIFGEASQSIFPSLFCGGFVLSLILVCVSNLNKNKTLITIVVAICVVVLAFYWHPIVWLFSLCVKVNSYWPRYTYTANLVLIFIALYSMFHVKKLNIKKTIVLLLIFVVICIICLAIFGVVRLEHTLITLSVFCLNVVVVICLLRTHAQPVKNILATVVLFSTCFILVANASIILPQYRYSYSKVDDFAKYNYEQLALLSSIKNSNDGEYRITQNTSRHSEGDGQGLQAKCNEALAFGFNGDSAYTSNSDTKQNKFLSQCGYNNPDELIQYSDTSILPVQSLIGARFILSETDLPYCNKLDTTSAINNFKDVYVNPYCFPLAFAVSTDNFDVEQSSNPLKYINDIYKLLFGHSVVLYSDEDVQIYNDTKNRDLLMNFDVQTLQYCSDQANKNKADIALWSNDKIQLSYYSEIDEQNLFVSVPYNNGWKITINGHDAEYELIGDCLYLLKLDKGENQISFKYSLF